MAKRIDSPSKHLKLLSIVISSTLLTEPAFANDYLDSAKKYLAKQETNAAVIELKNALQEAPKNGNARYLLGKILFKQGAFSSAEQQLARALKYNFDKALVTPLLARSLINQSKFDDAFLLIKELYSKQSEMPQDLLALSAVAEIKVNNIASAKTFLDKVDSSSFYTEYAQALYLFATDDKEQALIKITQLAETNQDEADLWLLKGHIETSLTQTENALKSYSKAYQLTPRASQYGFYIARSMVELNQFEKATPIIDNLLKINPQNPYINELKAITLMVKQEYSGAKLHADRAINSGMSHFRLLAMSGVSAFYLNQMENSYKIFKRLSSQLSTNHPINQLYIITQFKLGYIDDALKKLSTFPIESAKDSEFLSQISVELTKIGRKDLALEYANKAAEKATGKTETVLNFIRLANDDAEAIEDLLAQIKANPSSKDTKQGVANYYLTKGLFDKADSLANEWLKTNPNDTIALSIKALINKSNGQYPVAKTYFEQIQQLEPENLQAIVELALVEYVLGNKKRTSLLLIEAKKREPANHKINRVFLQYHQKMNQLSKAIAVIDQQLNTNPLNIHLSIQKADALSMNGQMKAAISLLEGLPKKNKRVWTTLSSFYLAMNDRKNLKRSYAQWLELDNKNPIAYLHNIKFLLEDNALIDSLKLTNKAEELFPNDTRFTLAKAEALLKQKKIKAATNEFAKVTESSSNTNDFNRIKGFVLLANDDFKAAEKVYEKRFALAPSSKLAYDLSSLYLKNQQEEKAISFLTSLVKKHSEANNSDFLRLKFLLAEIQYKRAPDKSMALYSEILNIQPNNIVALNNLSWLLFEQNQLTKACSFAKKAHDLASKSPNVADTYGYCLLKSGDTNNALDLLEFAYQGKKDDPQIALHFAEALIETEQKDKAADVLANIKTTKAELIATKTSLEKSLKMRTQ